MCAAADWLPATLCTCHTSDYPALSQAVSLWKVSGESQTYLFHGCIHLLWGAEATNAPV